MSPEEIEIVGNEIRARGFVIAHLCEGCPPSLREDFEHLLISLENDDMPEPY